MPDFLDAILEPKQQAAADTSKGAFLVVGVRCKSSAELEARETEYLSRTLLPIPFYTEAGELEELTKQDLGILKSIGITVSEYKQLVGESL